MEKMNIGEAIKELRKAQNITKEQLSEKTGISVSHLEKIESGARRPGIDTYHRLLNPRRVHSPMLASQQTFP